MPDGHATARPLAWLPEGLRAVLPVGRTLPDDVWARRHRFIVAVLVLHAAAIAPFALARGYEPLHAAAEASVVLLLAGLATAPFRSRALRSVFGAVGLVTTSAIFVHLSGGYIEMHFHFFIMIPLIALYQDWPPLLVSLTYVLLHHGVVGTLDPGSVFNHPDALAHPWKWAGIHAVFVLGATFASLFSWRLNEVAHEARQAMAQRLLESERAASALRTHLLRTASHELKTPMTPLRLQVELLRSERLGPLTAPQARAVAMLERNLDRLSDLVHDVLDVARLEDGRFAVHRESLDLRQAALEAVEPFRDVATQRGVALEVRGDGPVPVQADAKRLEQVLTNLLSNALKFTPAGGGVTLETARRGDHAVVRVRDTGAGLRADQLERLFEPFSQVHEQTPEGERGTGLGLFISKGIVDAHGGRLDAASDGPGRGATFTVTLPLRPPPAIPPTAAPRATPSVAR